MYIYIYIYILEAGRQLKVGVLFKMGSKSAWFHVVPQAVMFSQSYVLPFGNDENGCASRAVPRGSEIASAPKR